MAEEGKALYVQIGQLECSLHSQETHMKNPLWWVHLSSSASVGAWEVEVTSTSGPCLPHACMAHGPLPTQVSQRAIESLEKNHVFAPVSGFSLS